MSCLTYFTYYSYPCQYPAFDPAFDPCLCPCYASLSSSVTLDPAPSSSQPALRRSSRLREKTLSQTHTLQNDPACTFAAPPPINSPSLHLSQAHILANAQAPVPLPPVIPAPVHHNAVNPPVVPPLPILPMADFQEFMTLMQFSVSKALTLTKSNYL